MSTLTRIAAFVAPAVLSACGSWAPQAVPDNPNDPAQALYNSRKALYACQDAGNRDCSSERAAMLKADREAKDAGIRKVRELGGTSFKIQSM